MSNTYPEMSPDHEPISKPCCKMVDTVPVPVAPIPTDRFSSRTFWVVVGVVGLSLLLGAGALFTSFAEFDQVASFLQWVIATVVCGGFLKMGADKFAETKRGK